MIALSLLTALAAGCAAPVSLAQTALPSAEWSSPTFFADGLEFTVTLELQAAAEGGELPVWALTPAGFELNGQPLQKRAGPMLSLTPNQTLRVTLDLGPYLVKAPGFAQDTFTLKYAYPESGEPMTVKYGQAAAASLDFMELPVEQLADYQVLLSTSQGDLLCEFWPDVAPNHVRNFLDLAHTKFYDGTIFHRVIPGFMIQGGDPTGTGTGNGKRTLNAEFNDRRHVPGVLSMARSQSPNSASCQFFVMHGNATHLDGQYSAFGRLVSGLDVVQKIVSTPRNAQDRPNQKQELKKAIVLKRPANAGAGGQ